MSALYRSCFDSLQTSLAQTHHRDQPVRAVLQEQITEMSTLSLIRISISGDGAFGTMIWNGLPFCLTLEHTYPGQRGAWITKLLPGVYRLTRGRFNRGGYDTWEISGGPDNISLDRELKFHKGNWANESDGCPLVGEQFEWLDGKPALKFSGLAFQQLMDITADEDELQLVVRNA